MWVLKFYWRSGNGDPEAALTRLIFTISFGSNPKSPAIFLGGFHLRIISNFKDYYDSAINGVSQSDIPIFPRPRDKDPLKIKRSIDVRLSLEQIDFHYGCIYLCEKLFPFIYFSFKSEDYYFYTFEHINKFLKEHISNDAYKKWSEEDEDYYNTTLSSKFKFKGALGLGPLSKWRSNENIKGTYKYYFNKYTKDAVLASVESGYFGYTVLEINPILKSMQFAKIMPAFEVYQTIEQYLSNRGEPQNPTVLVKDKDLVTAKGFDKWSFRKMPDVKN